MAKTTERIIRITVDASKSKKPLEKIKTNLKGIETQGKKTNRSLSSMVTSLNMLRTVTSAVLVGTGIAAVAKMSDAYTNLNSRIKLVTDSEDERKAALKSLNDISTRTFTDLESNATLFNRITTSMKEYNIEAGTVLAITESLSQTLRISGSTSQEAKSGIIQFTQGLAKGRFDGDELKNILEGNIRLQRIFADAMGVSTSKLKELGAEGKITASKVLPALVGELEKLREESKSIAPTLGGAFTVLNNNMTLVVGKLLEVTKIAQGLAFVIMLVADNLHIVVAVIGTALVGALVAATPAVIAFGTAFVAANAPIIAVVASIALVAVAVGLIFAAFWDGYPAFKQGLVVLETNFVTALLRIRQTFLETVNLFRRAGSILSGAGDPGASAKIIEGKKKIAHATAVTIAAEEKYWALVNANENTPKVTLDSLKKQVEALLESLKKGGGGKKAKAVKDTTGDRLKGLQDELEMMGRITKESQIQGEIINMTRIIKKGATNEDLISISKQIDAKKQLLDMDKRALDVKNSLGASEDSVSKAIQSASSAVAEYTTLLENNKITQQEFITGQALAWEEVHNQIALIKEESVELTGFLGTLHDAMDGFSGTAAEGLVDMTELLFQAGKGWEDFGDIVKSVVKSIARDIAVMGMKEFVTNPLFDIMKTGLAGAAAGGGGSTFMGDATEMGLTGLSGASAPVSAPAAPSFRPNFNSSAKVSIVNVIDPAVVGEFMNTKEGEDTVVNMLSNSDSFKVATA